MHFSASSRVFLFVFFLNTAIVDLSDSIIMMYSTVQQKTTSIRQELISVTLFSNKIKSKLKANEAEYL